VPSGVRTAVGSANTGSNTGFSYVSVDVPPPVPGTDPEQSASPTAETLVPSARRDLRHIAPISDTQKSVRPDLSRSREPVRVGETTRNATGQRRI
jgi:hypothetical protein